MNLNFLNALSIFSWKFFSLKEITSYVLEPIPLPCTVKMVRLSSRRLDSDNLQMAFKWIRDQLGECLIPEDRKFYIDKKGKMRELKGRCDDNPMIKWEYDQEKSKEPGIRIEISYD